MLALPTFSRTIFLVGFTVLIAACTTPPGEPSTNARAGAAGGTSSLSFPGGTINVDTRGAGCQITLNGELHDASVRRMDQAMQQVAQARCRDRLLVLNVSNGLLGDAITLGSMARNRGYDTQVQARTTCNTPCLLVFAAGRNRTMPTGPAPARIAFSQIPPDQDFGRTLCETELSRAQQLTLTRYLRAMLPSNTATTVYQKIQAATCRNTDVYGPDQALVIGLATGTR